MASTDTTAGPSKWKHLKAAMADFHDLLRCWTCNQLLVDPVSYRCGHFFCSHCAKEAGTKCSSCNIPCLPSEIRPDRTVASVIGYFQTLSLLVNSDKSSSLSTNVCNSGKKSSRSTLYESDDQQLGKTNQTDIGPVVPRTSLDRSGKDDSINVTTPISKDECNAKETPRKADESSSKLEIDEGKFLKPSRVRKTSLKGNKRAVSASKTDKETAKQNESIASSNQSTAKKVGKPRGRPPKKRPSLESKLPEGKSGVGSGDEDNTFDNCTTPKKPRRCNNTPNSTPSASKRDMPDSVKSTPRRSVAGTPGREYEKKNHKGETPLHVACIKGNVDKIRSLLDANANPNTKDNAGWTPLHEVANHGFTEAVQLLLKAGALVDVPGVGNVTPLHEAVYNKHLPIVKLLVAHGANIYARSSEGKTPMDLANSPEMEEALVQTQKTIISANLDAGNNKPDLASNFINLYGDSGLTAEEKDGLSEIAINLNARLVQEFGPHVTHFVASSDVNGSCPPSMEVLCAILTGMTLLTRDWINISKESDISTVDYEIFELSGVSDFVDAEAPKRSRENSQKQLPGLFNGCHFYVSSNACYKLPNFTLSRANIITLIKTGGGIVLYRQPDPEAIPPAEQTVPYHAPGGGLLTATSHFILYSPGKGEPEMKYNMKHCKTLTVEWFVNCVLNWQLIDP
ncbi:hypothetical protein ONE63_007824 [Megalurothrips usitatus]|uniref:BRCA1-associated RING domain protein 1-like n=1 Tax=Megalurothrips usitatus TaxID=439358 RepID=A0AAV7XVE0_9NEOP|nr:hypothetical protein ONE63_007824 [Megalurothrips usitatus]